MYLLLKQLSTVTVSVTVGQGRPHANMNEHKVCQFEG